jgi:hypothetical protein
MNNKLTTGGSPVELPNGADQMVITGCRELFDRDRTRGTAKVRPGQTGPPRFMFSLED